MPKLDMTRFSNEQIEQMAAEAVELFKQGFNCSQSVFAACAPAIYGMEQDLALRVSASFGGGIGRMRGVCGAASGMFLLAGLQNGSATPGDADGKMHNYALVQQLAEGFVHENGSLFCSELLGLAPKPGELSATPRHEMQSDTTSPKPAERTSKYFAKRPCVEMVRGAVRLYLETLNGRQTLE